jgi:hypothetical protein
VTGGALTISGTADDSSWRRREGAFSNYNFT